MISFLTTNLMWTEGAPMLVLLILLCIIGSQWPSRVLWYGSCAMLVFCFYFFRNPERICPQASDDDRVIVCPSDGKVIDVRQEPAGSEYAQRVSIFLSLFDVHVNWVPIAGMIESIAYKPGTFSFAFLPKSSDLNEHNDVVIRRADGVCVKVRQIAGTLARRISCWVKPGQQVDLGQKFGMIRFGSRVDIFVPATVQIMVGTGQRVYGGQTVLGRLGN